MAADGDAVLASRGFEGGRGGLVWAERGRVGAGAPVRAGEPEEECASWKAWWALAGAPSHRGYVDAVRTGLCSLALAPAASVERMPASSSGGGQRPSVGVGQAASFVGERDYHILDTEGTNK